MNDASGSPRPPGAGASAASLSPSFWRRRIVAPLLSQLTQGVTPEKLALTLGVGLAAGVFPFLGFTTALCFAAALALRLNQPVIHVLNQLLWPIQLAGIPLYVWLGQKIYGAPPVPVDPQEIARVFSASPREFWTRFGLMGLHAFTAWLLTMPVLVGGCYFGARPLLQRLASKRRADT